MFQAAATGTLETAAVGQATLPGGDSPVRLFAADLDNNGAVDLVFSGRSVSGILLTDAQNNLQLRRR